MQCIAPPSSKCAGQRERHIMYSIYHFSFYMHTNHVAGCDQVIGAKDVADWEAYYTARSLPADSPTGQSRKRHDLLPA